MARSISAVDSITPGSALLAPTARGRRRGWGCADGGGGCGCWLPGPFPPGPRRPLSSTLDRVGWNAELVGRDLRAGVEALEEQPGAGLALGGVTLPLALADVGLIDE